jgi:hypothetical protein
MATSSGSPAFVEKGGCSLAFRAGCVAFASVGESAFGLSSNVRRMSTPAPMPMPPLSTTDKIFDKSERWAGVIC